MSELNKSKKRSKTALKDESEEIVVQKKRMLSIITIYI